MKFNRVVLTAVATAGLIGSVYADPAPYCIAVNGGFDNGGTTFVARQFDAPGPNKCTPWAGYTKIPATVVLATSGTACLSDDGNVLTVGVSSFNPNWTGGAFAPDYIQLCPEGSMCTDADVGVLNNPLAGNGYDSGFVGGPGFGSPAAQIDCTDDVLDLPSSHA
jgi:hypothetical protein